MLSTQPRPKKCAMCPNEFLPVNSMHSCCGPRCALRKARKDRTTKERQEKEQIRARKAALQTIPQLIAAAQKVFNAYIRARDKDKGCFVCGRPFEDRPGRVQHAGHVRSRGAAGHLRFTEDNVLGECEGCNGPHGAKPHQIKAGAIERIGAERFAELEADNTPHKWQRDELLGIIATYRAKLKELKSELRD